MEIIGWGVLCGDNCHCEFCGKNISDDQSDEDRKGRVMVSGEETDYEMVPCCGKCSERCTKDRVQEVFRSVFG